MNGTWDSLKHENSTKGQQEPMGTKILSLPDFDITAKVMLVGDSSVGKTCLLTKFRDDKFLSGSFICTVGIDFRNKVVDVDGTKVKMQVWDTAGQERFRSITRAYYREAEALLIVYDVTNQESFDNVRSWVTEIQECAKTDTIMMLLGNKADLVSERVVPEQEGHRLAQECGIPFMETSAKTGMNVELSFTALARTLKEMKSPGSKIDKKDGKKSLQGYIIRNPEPSTSCSC